ncbi:MAG: hypothetical protein A3D10_06280 [Omnitrophica WOR_2 bacterium RIFCSPHIGHO2_02_FULL_48_11]|nr:MAG: hypothetical protein A3D10_06280 [Omnitrophica WOR_2 bacterium RIFCSPHIGHO2_02_FULL_48_11]
MKIRNLTQNTVLALEAKTADTSLSRMTGLLNRSSLGDHEALIITHCQSIHMLFMRFAIDVIFVDRTDRVVGLVEGIKPYRLSPIFFKAHYAVEVKEGVIKNSKTQLGDQLALAG